MHKKRQKRHVTNVYIVFVQCCGGFDTKLTERRQLRVHVSGEKNPSTPAVTNCCCSKDSALTGLTHYFQFLTLGRSGAQS